MKQDNTDQSLWKASRKKKKGTNVFKQAKTVNEIILTTFVGGFVVFEIFRYKERSSIDFTLVRILK